MALMVLTEEDVAIETDEIVLVFGLDEKQVEAYTKNGREARTQVELRHGRRHMLRMPFAEFMGHLIKVKHPDVKPLELRAPEFD